VKLSKLYLKAFGPYTERLIDFDAAGGSLHIVYGPNEAGKSSLLRAIRALLYGILERTQDNFLHDHSSLRIGGVIADGKGRQLSVMRRKARKGSLREWDGNMSADCEGGILPENAIADFLGGIGETEFSRLFGIDREELIRGGRAILEGQGDVGESLFEAGSGLVGLRRVRAALEAEAGDLFAQQARKPLINATLGEYGDVRRATREAVVRSDEWARREDANRTAVDLLDANKKIIAEKRLEKERLSRILRNLPLIARRTDCMSSLADLSGVPDLPPDVSEKRVASVTREANAERRRTEAEAKVAELEGQLEALAIPGGYVVRGALIEGVFSHIGAFQKAMLELPALEAQERTQLELAKSRLRDLGLPVELGEAESFRPKKSEQTRIRQLIKQRADLRGRHAELRRGAVDLEAELAEAEHALGAKTPPVDPGDLDDATQAGSPHADSERRLSEFARDIANREQDLERRIHSLGDRSAIELRDVRIPAKATLQRLEQEWDAISRERNVIGSQLAQRRIDLAALQAERATLEAGGVVASEDELGKARAHRDLGWTFVRQGYIERTADPSDLREKYPGGDALPEAYEKSIERSDAIVDSLRLDTKRTAEHAIALKRIAQVSAAIADDAIGLRDLEARQERWREEWAPVNYSIGLNAVTVREVEEWIGERDHILMLLSDIEQRRQKAEEIRIALAAARERLGAELRARGEPASSDEMFASLLGKARRLLERMRRLATEYEDSKKAVVGLQGEVARQRGRIRGVEAELVDWQSRWDTAARAIGLAESVDVEEAEELLVVQEELFNAVDGAQRIGQALDENRAASRRYAEEVSSIVLAVGGTMHGKSVPDIVAELFARHQEALKIVQHRRQVSEQLDGERQALTRATEELQEGEKELAALCIAGGVADVASLPAVEEKARRKSELEAEVSRIEEQLGEQNSSPLNRVLEEATGIGRDGLIIRIADLEEEAGALEAAQILLAKGVRDSELALAEVDGSGKAAEEAQTAQEILARLRDATEEFARLKTSSFVIRRTIEAYRQKHQGPILMRASEYFATLTRGSFRGLDLDFSEDDRQVLVGVRSNGKPVSVQGMSEGVQDQLYLALRLAAIEHHLEAGSPIPVIVDDILVQFDDVRAKAAFEALGMLATRTQVLLFTHHEHLLALAEAATPKGVLAVHRLESPAGV
jgi:exonuclease SbcC